MQFEHGMTEASIPKRLRGSFLQWQRHHHTPIEDLFWKRVKKGTEEQCWPFRGEKHDKGYGTLRVGGERGRKWYAHRLAWTLTYGPIQKGTWVLHKCDNPPCCNPNHLFLGDNAANMQDAARKGRCWLQKRPEESPRRKLTAAQVREIRASYIPWRVSRPTLAKRFGVSLTSINYVLNGRTWKHIT